MHPKKAKGTREKYSKAMLRGLKIMTYCQFTASLTLDKMKRSPPRGSDSFLLALFFQGCNKTEFIMRVAGSMDFLGDIWADASLAFLVLMNMS